MIRRHRSVSNGRNARGWRGAGASAVTPLIYGISGWDASTALATASGQGVDGSAAGVSLVFVFYLNSVPVAAEQQIRRIGANSGYDLSCTSTPIMRAQFGTGATFATAPTRTLVADDVGKIHVVGMSADVAGTAAYFYFDRAQVGASTPIASFAPAVSTMALGSTVTGTTPSTSFTILGVAGRDTPLTLADYQTICDATKAAKRLALGGVTMLHSYAAPQGGAMPSSLPDTIGAESMTFAVGAAANLDVVTVPDVWGF